MLEQVELHGIDTNEIYFDEQMSEEREQELVEFYSDMVCNRLQFLGEKKEKKLK